jgi:hypothetical protein
MNGVGVNQDREQVSQALARINEAWLQGRPRDLASLFDSAIVMVFPGFAGRAEGRAAVIAGFEDYCANARTERFEQTDKQVDVVGSVAVASFAFEMTYQRAGARYRSSGRDLWVFSKEQGRWLAVWRTMLDLREEAVR